MRIGCIITARMASARFPGKSMADLYGRPMIEWLVDKGQRTPFVDEVVVATTTLPEDDAMAAYFETKCEVFRGDPDNIVLRVLDCMHLYVFSHSLHPSGDSPFVSQLHMDAVAQLMAENPEGYDTYAVPDDLCKIEGKGCSAGALSHYQKAIDAWRSFPEDLQKEYEETCTALAGRIYTPTRLVHPTFVHGDIRKTDMKLSIDYPAELMMANAVCRCLGRFPETSDEIHWAYGHLKASDFRDPA